MPTRQNDPRRRRRQRSLIESTERRQLRVRTRRERLRAIQNDFNGEQSSQSDVSPRKNMK
jgi:hypothetical protein